MPTKSDQVSVLAGIWTTRLHGTTTVPWLSFTVPPKRAGSDVFGQLALVESTVAAWTKPVSSKLWMVAAGAPSSAADGVGRFGVENGGTAPAGGFAVPPPANALDAPSGNASRLSAAIGTTANATCRRPGRREGLNMVELHSKREQFRCQRIVPTAVSAGGTVGRSVS